MIWRSAAAFWLAASTSQALAQKSVSVFTVASYPVEASAASAVAAKEKALTEGQNAAFRSLLKRLVPVTAYKQLTRISSLKASDFVSGVSVRSERNSATDYIASLDFVFQADEVRRALIANAIPYVDRQAEPVTIIPVTVTAGDVERGDGRSLWRTAWSGLDLKHALTPVRLDGLKAEIHGDTVRMVVGGDDNGFRIISKEYQADRILLAVAEPDPAAKRLSVTLAGIDAVGPFVLKRSYRVTDGDLAYASELAAVVALGTLEGRWKAVRSGETGEASVDAERPVWSAAGGGAGESMQLLIEFSNATQWNDIRAQLLDTPGVESMEIGAMSDRHATVSLRFPGGVQRLANAVGARGLTLINSSQGWVLRSLN